MKRHLVSLTVLAALSFSLTLHSQPSFKKASKFTLSAGIGTLPTFINEGTTSNVPPLCFRLGYNVTKRFNLNTYVGYTHVTSGQRVFDDGLASSLENKSLLTGLRAQIAQPVSKNLEIYGGGFIGYNFTNVKEFDSVTGLQMNRDPEAPTPYDPNAPNGQLLYSGFIGGNYFFGKSIGIFGEIGYGISLGTIGLTFRI